MFWREVVAAQNETSMVGAVFADDEEYDQDNQEERPEEDPSRLHHAVAAHGHRFGRVDGSEHGDHVSADGDVFTEVDAAEETHKTVADQGVVTGCDPSEEVDHVVLGFAVQVDVAEEDHNIAGDLALDTDATEEADRIVDGFAGGHVDIGAELNLVVIGMSRGGGSRKGGSEQAEDKLLDHDRRLSINGTRKPGSKFRRSQRRGRGCLQFYFLGQPGKAWRSAAAKTRSASPVEFGAVEQQR